MSLQVTTTFTINAPAERIWSIMADDFVDVAHWASGLDSSRPNPQAVSVPPGATTGGRVCEVPGLGFTDERITVYDPSTHELGYSVDAEKIPSFVTGMENRWRLTARGPDRTEVHQSLTATLHGPMGTLMRPVMRRQFAKLLAPVREDLTAYAETGRVSARKAAESTTNRA